MDQAKKKLKAVIKRQERGRPPALKLMVILLSSIGLLLQVYNTLAGYLQYNQTTEVSVKSNTDPITPAISTCFGFWNLLPGEFNISISSEEEINSNLYDMTRVCKTRDRSSKTTYCRRHEQEICLLIQRTEISTVTEFTSIARVDVQYDEFSNDTLLMSLFVHQNGTYPYYSESSRMGFYVGAQQRTLYDLSYTLVTSHLLNSPYPDHCTNYQTLNLTTRGHCISMCRNASLFTQYGGDAHDIDLVSKTFKNKLNADNSTNYDQVKKLCESLCGMNCTSKSYFPIVVDKYGGSVRLGIYLFNSGPHFILQSSPAVRLWSLIIYLAGILSAWTDITYLVVTISIVHILWGFQLFLFGNSSDDQPINTKSESNNDDEVRKLTQIVRSHAIRLNLHDARMIHILRTSRIT